MIKTKKHRLVLPEELRLPAYVAILHSDARREYFHTEAQYITEKDAQADAQTIAGILAGLGIQARLYPGDDALPERLRQERPELVLNLVDSVKGHENLAAAIPGVLELLDLPYTGADMQCMTLDTNKFMTQQLLRQNGVPVPNFQLFNAPEDLLDPSLRFPLISKLNGIHGSVEITADAVSETEKQLRKRLRFLIRTYQQPVLVEEFIAGREITAIVVGDHIKKVFAAEKVFFDTSRKYQFLTFEEQWLQDSSLSFRYRKFKDALLKEYVKRAFQVLGMYDYAKFDIRMDQSGRYFFIDSNCNPALGPKEQDVAIALILDRYGVSFEELLAYLVSSNLRPGAANKRFPLPPAELPEPEPVMTPSDLSLLDPESLD